MFGTKTYEEKLSLISLLHAMRASLKKEAKARKTQKPKKPKDPLSFLNAEQKEIFLKMQKEKS